MKDISDQLIMYYECRKWHFIY